MGLFRYDMSQIHGIFPSETPHGTAEASHGMRNRWDVSGADLPSNPSNVAFFVWKERGELSQFLGKSAQRAAPSADVEP